MKKITKASGSVMHTAKKVKKTSKAPMQTMKNKRAGYKDSHGSFTITNRLNNTSTKTIE